MFQLACTVAHVSQKVACLTCMPCMDMQPYGASQSTRHLRYQATTATMELTMQGSLIIPGEQGPIMPILT